MGSGAGGLEYLVLDSAQALGQCIAVFHDVAFVHEALDAFLEVESA